MAANPGPAIRRELDVRLLRFRSGNTEEDGIELARALLDANRHAEAIEVCADGRSASVDPVEALLLEGRAWTKQGDLLRSQSSFVRAARLAPKDCRPFHALGEVLLKRGDPDRALAALSRALTLAPEHPEIKRLHERAVRLARVAESVSPNDHSPSESQSRVAAASAANDSLDDIGMRDTAVPDLEQQIPPASTKPVPISDDKGRGGRGRQSPRRRQPSLKDMGASRDMASLKAPLKKPLRSGGTASTRFRESISALRRAIAESSPINSSKPPASSKDVARKGAAERGEVGGGVSRAGSNLRRAERALARPSPTDLDGQSMPKVEGSKSSNEGVPGSIPPGQRSSSFPSLHSVAPNSSIPPPIPARSRKDSLSRSDADNNISQRKPVHSSPFAPASFNGAAQSKNGRGNSDFPFESNTPTHALRVNVHVPRLDSGVPSEASIQDHAPEDEPAASRGHHGLAMEDTQLAPVPEAPTKASKAPRSMRPGSKSGEYSKDGFGPGEEFGLTPVPPDAPFASPEQSSVPAERVSAETISISQLEPARTGKGLRAKLLWVGAAVLVVLLSSGALWMWFNMREQKAHALMKMAEQQVLLGSHEDLMEAESSAEDAMTYYRSEKVRSLAVRIQIQKALDEGFAGLEKLRNLIEDGANGDQSFRLARALIAFRKGQTSDAQQVLEEFAQKPPKDPHLLYLYARLRLELRYERDPALLERIAKSHSNLLAAHLALAEHAFVVGDIEKAGEHIQYVLKKKPRHVRARLWSDLLRHQELEDKPNPKTGTVLDKNLEVQGTTNEVLRHMLASEMLLTLREQKKARVQMGEGLEAAGNDPHLLRILSIWLLRQGFPGPAILASQRALEASPDHMAARLFLAEGLIRRRNGASALRMLGPLSSKDPEVLGLMARSSLLLGTKRALRASMQSLRQHSAAESSLWGVRHKVLRMWTQARLDIKTARDVRGAIAKVMEGLTDPEALKLIARASVDMRWNSLGERAVDALRSAGGVSADMLVLRAQVARASGKTDKAKRSLTKALTLRPWYYEAQREQALLFRETGDLDAAKRELKNLVGREGWDADSPELLVLRIELMRTLIAQDRSSEARSILSNLPLKNRGVPEVRPIEARILLAEGKAKEAVEKLRTVAEAPTASAEALVLYGNALAKTPEWEDSSEQYKRAIEVDPKNLDAIFGLALSYLRAEAPKTTLRLVEKAFSIMEESPSAPSDQARALVLEGRAQLQRRRKYHSDGYKALKKAIAIESAPPEAWYFFGEASESESEAKRAYKKYVELAPKGRFAERAKRKLAR